MKNQTKLNLLIVLFVSTLSSSLAYAETHSITNSSNEQMRIEGRNTKVPEDLYFSELIEPGETKQYSGGAHRPYFAITVVDESGKIKAHSGELPTDTNSHINIIKNGTKTSMNITKMKNNRK